MTTTKHRQNRPEAYDMADVDDMLGKYGESLSWTAWRGYQTEGRGVVAIYMNEGTVRYVSRKNLAQLQCMDEKKLQDVSGDVDVYNPQTDVLLLVIYEETDTYNGQCLLLGVVPPIPPPQAKRDMVTTFNPREDRGH